MALDLSRGLIPNLYLWFGQHFGPFTLPGDNTFTYPTIRPVSTKPPCTPEIIGEICDPRCPTDQTGCGSTEMPLFNCENFILLDSPVDTTLATREACSNYDNALFLVRDIREAQMEQGVDLIDLPSNEVLLTFTVAEMFAFYYNLIRDPALYQLGIRIQLPGQSDPCKIILKNEAFINEC